MTSEQESKCAKIIHSCAAGAGAGNLVPVPGVGIAADTVALTTMAASLAGVFGKDISNEVAKAMAISALKQAVTKQPVKVLAKELSKFVPFLGQVVAPTISVAMLEAAGWSLAKDLDRRSQEMKANNS